MESFMRITLITGFLGAGKTTFLRRFLKEHPPQAKFGAIINDLSQLEVDGELIRMGHLVSEEEGTLVSLCDGSISGNRLDDLLKAVEAMRDAGIEHLLIETSGGSESGIVARELYQRFPGLLHAVAAFIDARMLLHDYDGGRSLLAHSEAAPTLSAEALLVGQLRSASVSVLTKLDLIPEAKLPAMLRVLQTLNPAATLAGCAHGKLDSTIILNAPAYAPIDEKVARPVARGSDIGTLVISDPRPLHPQRFYDLYRERLGVGLFRSKGFIWFASRPAQVLLWNQAGGAMGLEFLATWRAAVLAHDTQLLPEEKQLLREQLANLHPIFGDHSCDLTLIGHTRDREIFGRELVDCFCTAEEIQHWKNGGVFPDPWPANLKVIQ